MENLSLEESQAYASYALESGRNDDSLFFFKAILLSKPSFSKEEREKWAKVLKESISKRRTAWRALSAFSQKPDFEKFFGGKKKRVYNFYKEKIEGETIGIIQEAISMISNFLLPFSAEIEAKIFYMKLNADLLRYSIEINPSKQQEKDALTLYEECMKICKEKLHPASTLTLSILLNYSVFCHDIMGNTKKAISLCEKAIREALESLDKLEDEDYKDSTTVLQFLQDNLIAWKKEN